MSQRKVVEGFLSKRQCPPSSFLSPANNCVPGGGGGGGRGLRNTYFLGLEYTTKVVRVWRVTVCTRSCTYNVDTGEQLGYTRPDHLPGQSVKATNGYSRTKFHLFHKPATELRGTAVHPSGTCRRAEREELAQAGIFR